MAVNFSTYYFPLIFPLFSFFSRIFHHQAKHADLADKAEGVGQPPGDLQEGRGRGNAEATGKGEDEIGYKSQVRNVPVPSYLALPI